MRYSFYILAFACASASASDIVTDEDQPVINKVTHFSALPKPENIGLGRVRRSKSPPPLKAKTEGSAKRVVEERAEARLNATLKHPIRALKRSKASSNSFKNDLNE